jgi:hypothetical protein
MFLHSYLVASFSLKRQVPELLAIPGAWALTNVITGDILGTPFGADMPMIVNGDQVPLTTSVRLKLTRLEHSHLDPEGLPR